MPRAEGSFAVTLTPQPSDTRPGASFLGRLLIEKIFSGDLAGRSVGQMLSARSPVEGSAGYVAIERVEGALNGHAGSFMLQHSGHADRSRTSLRVNVVADSGMDELSGLRGEMQINVAPDGTHFYVFDYTFDFSA
ncbi:MAG: DUF3224 domain-containing protein [Alphaproteobacteria bacterium]|nr:DUF3224 domain-containing protein [Alphaproteobacteria bacterium]